MHSYDFENARFVPGYSLQTTHYLTTHYRFSFAMMSQIDQFEIVIIISKSLRWQ